MIKHIYDIYHIFGGGEGERKRKEEEKMREIDDRQEKKRKQGNTSPEKFLPHGK